MYYDDVTGAFVKMDNPFGWMGEEDDDGTRRTSAYTGVLRSSDRTANKWRVRACRIHLGMFIDETEAARAYDRKILEIRGADAVTNFPASDYGYAFDAQGQAKGSWNKRETHTYAPTASTLPSSSSSSPSSSSSSSSSKSKKRKAGAQVSPPAKQAEKAQKYGFKEEREEDEEEDTTDYNMSYKGVRHYPSSMNGGRGRWMARMKVNGKEANLGTFDHPKQAALAYDAALVHYGGTAAPNFNYVEEEGEDDEGASEEASGGGDGGESSGGALPEGWWVETTVRQSGLTAGTVDKYFRAPDGKRCRSMLEVHRHAAAMGGASATSVRVCDTANEDDSTRRSSAYIGVTRPSGWKEGQRNEWRAIASRIFLGTFDDEQEAARAFDRKVLEMRGVGTKTNFPASEYGHSDYGGNTANTVAEKALRVRTELNEAETDGDNVGASVTTASSSGDRAVTSGGHMCECGKVLTSSQGLLIHKGRHCKLKSTGDVICDNDRRSSVKPGDNERNGTTAVHNVPAQANPGRQSNPGTTRRRAGPPPRPGFRPPQSNPGSKAKPVEGRRSGSTNDDDWERYASQTEAARKCGINVGSVSLCVSGKHSEAGGFQFRYATKPENTEEDNDDGDDGDEDGKDDEGVEEEVVDDDDEDDDEEEVGEKSGDGSRKRKSLLSGPAPLEAQWGVSFVGGKGEMEGNGRRRMEMVTDPATHRAGTY